MAVGNPRRRDWLTWLAAQRDWQGQAVPPRMRHEIEHEHGRLMLVRERLDALTPAAAEADPTPAAAQMTQRGDLLRKLKCLGPAFATTLTNEVFYKDFRNRREVASYFGLAPSPWRSGGIDREQGISKAGNPRPLCRDRTGLAVAAASAGQCAHRMVSKAHAQCWQAQQARRHRGPGAQADGRALALSHIRSCARGSGAQGGEGVTINQRVGVAASAAVSAGWMVTVPP